LQDLRHENAELRDRLTQEGRHRIDQALDAAVPNWRQVDQDQRWLNWLLMPEPLSGRIRQELLNEAAARGDATAVVAFFRGFLREAGQAPQQTRAAASYPTTALGKPIYSRAQILHYANLRRKGAINDTDWARWEHELCAASREGRIAGGLPLDGGR
jgi:hypothetical protein